MTENEQRIAIAKWCGYTLGQCNNPTSSYVVWIKDGVWVESLPDYLHDLNAIREAEKRLAGPAVSGVHPGADSDYVDKLSQLVGYKGFGFVTATAAQRCEALLKTVGLWKEAP